MKYKIKINYNTGDSFGSQNGLEDFLELSWEDIENAKKNLKRIEEHYKLYRSSNSYFSHDEYNKLLNEFKGRDWMVASEKSLIKLYSDNGEPWQIWPFWVGYFESLNYCEIISDNSDLKFVV